MELCSSLASLTRYAALPYTRCYQLSALNNFLLGLKTPVQKWQTSDIQAVRLEKNKHVHIDVGGPNAANLHFHAGSKEVADAIMAKLEEARLPDEEPAAVEPESELAPEPQPERPRSSAAKSVHFDASEPEIIPIQDAEEDEGEPDEEPQEQADDGLGEGERAVVLYDFTADGEDEMSVHEGETLVVLERDTDEWWKCRNAQGDEGVVPANYLEVSFTSRITVPQTLT